MPPYGWHHTEEAREKNRLAHLGKHPTEETRAKLSLASMGNTGFLGHHHSKETRAKISQTTRGRRSNHHGKYPTAETRAKLSLAHRGEKHPMYGKHHAEETKTKMRLAHLGKHRSDETKAKISLANSRRHITKETRAKLREAQLGTHHTAETRAKLSKNHHNVSGVLNPNWLGGISFEPYPPAFNGGLKAYIRQRDNYTCQLCGIGENGRRHTCHHIDYDKLNSLPSNLITLCLPCNIKVNVNRQHWIAHFNVRRRGNG